MSGSAPLTSSLSLASHRTTSLTVSRSELGHTRCIGEELAMMEMKLALILTVRELDFDFGLHISDKEGSVVLTRA